MKYFIVQSDNNAIEKNYIPYKFFDEKVKSILQKNLKYITTDFNFYIDVLNSYLNCSFFTGDKKNVIRKFKRKIEIIKRYYK
jgi:hypothetical protein